MRRICVFCGSNHGTRPAYRAAAINVGELLASRGIGLVYGGSNVGLMGVVADTVLAGGGEVVGVIPRGLVEKEVAHRNLTDLRIVGSMHERKALMVELADGFLALPGGFGTFDELCEVLSWAQLGLHTKPVALLNVEGYFDPLLAMFDHATSEGMLRPEHRAMVLEVREPEEALRKMAAHRPADVPKWITLAES